MPTRHDDHHDVALRNGAASYRWSRCRRPAREPLARASARPGSPSTGETPAFTARRPSGLMSQPMTSAPFAANWAASGRPILPRPTTATFTSESLARAGRPAGPSRRLGQRVGDRERRERIIAGHGHRRAVPQRRDEGAQLALAAAPAARSGCACARRRRRAASPAPASPAPAPTRSDCVRLVELQRLRRVVEHEEPVLAEDGQLAHLARREPVHLEHADGAPRPLEAQEPASVSSEGVRTPGCVCA